jgi:hypothetical protein
VANPLLLGCNRNRKGSFDWPQAAVQRKFSQEEIFRKVLFEQGSIGPENTNCHREVKSRTLFLDCCWCQVYGDVLEGEIQTTVFDRGFDAFLAFLYGSIGKTNRQEHSVAG